MSKFPQSNFVQGGFYHIYNRGNNKQDIFKNNMDYKRYQTYLKQFKQKHNVSVIAYCLMPNHVHLLLRQNGPDPLSNFMQRVHTAYSMYFNKKYQLVGHLFQGPFKTKIIKRDEYLTHLSRYIHLNPQKLVTKLPSYKYSSYPVYIGANVDDLVDTKFVLPMFKRKNQTLQDAQLSYKLFVRSQALDITLIDHLTFDE